MSQIFLNFFFRLQSNQIRKYIHIEYIYYSSPEMFERQKTIGLASLEKSWDSMDENQRVQYTNSVKAKAAVMLIQATQFVELKNPDRAKELLVQIADSCMCVKDPDEQVLKWIQISCSYLAILHRNSQQKKAKSTQNLDRKGWHNRENIVVLKYNKFSGQFQPDQYQQAFVNQDVLQYVSKINMILFGCQNVENNHSLYTMFTSYWIPFSIAFALLVLAFIFLAGQNFLSDNNSEFNTNFQIPALIIGCLLVLPLLMIFLKVLQQKDNSFFQKKLGQQIKRINQDCKARNNKIQFMMPHGGQINVKLGKQDQLSQGEGHDEVHEQNNQTPQDQFMNKIKGLTREISKISGASIASFKC